MYNDNDIYGFYSFCSFYVIHLIFTLHISLNLKPIQCCNVYPAYLRTEMVQVRRLPCIPAHGNGTGATLNLHACAQKWCRCNVEPAYLRIEMALVRR